MCFRTNSLPSTSSSHRQPPQIMQFDDLTDYLNTQLWWLPCGVLQCCFGLSRVSHRPGDNHSLISCWGYCLFPNSWNNTARLYAYVRFRKQNKEAPSSSHLTASQPLLSYVPLSPSFAAKFSQAHGEVRIVCFVLAVEHAEVVLAIGRVCCAVLCC
jgi:hypothetical protein